MFFFVLHIQQYKYGRSSRMLKDRVKKNFNKQSMVGRGK